MSAIETRHGRLDVSASDESDEQCWQQSRFEGVRVESSGSDCNLSDLDLESGVLEMKAHFVGNINNKVEVESESQRECRICQLELEGERTDCGVPVQLGCSCKGDLGSAHKQCADTWFKIKGDTICEICGVTALNIAANDRANEPNIAAITAPSATTGAPVILVETIWHGRRIMNFLLACMVLAFITSWLFHFKIL